MADLGTIGISIEVRGRDALRQIEGDMNSIDRSTKNAARSFEVFERAGLKTAETFRYMSEQSKKRLVDEQRITQEIVKQRAAVEQLALANAQKSQAQIGRNLGLGAKGISAGASAGAITAEVERLRLKYDQIYASSQLYERSLKEIDQAHMLGVLSVKQHEAALESLNMEYQNFQNGVDQAGNRFAQHSAQTASGMSKFGVAAQQTGYQVSDFIVQVQGGTNPLVAFSQQATQLAGLLYLLPPATQAARIGMLGFSVSMATATAGLTIIIPLFAMLAMAFFSSGKDAEEGSKGVDKYKNALDGLKASIQSTQVELDKLTFGTKDEEIAVALRAMQDAQTAVTELIASQRQIRGQAAPTQEEKAAIDEMIVTYRDLLLTLNEMVAKKEALAAAQVGIAAAEEASRVQNLYKLQLLDEQQVRLENGKKLVKELLSTYTDVGGAVKVISEIDLKAVFEDAVPASSSLYQFVSDTYNTMLNMSKFQPQDYSGFVYGGARAETRMAGSSFPPVDKKTIDSVKQYGSSVNKATKELTAAEKAAKEFADSMQGYVVGAVQSVSDAFGDFVMRGFKDFKGFVNSILSSFTSMLAQMIALAARNQIMISMGMSGAGMVAGGVASAATGGMGGIGGIATGIGGAFGTIGSGLMAGAGLALNGGMAGIVGGVTGGLSAFTSGIGAIGSVAGAGSMALGGLATAIGAIAVPIAAVAAVFSFFKKKTKELDSGLLITVNNMDSLIQTFKKTETKRFWGLSRKVSSSTGAASSEIADPIETAVSAIQNSIVDMAGALSIGSEAFDNFYFQLKLSLKGLSAEEATAKIQEELMKVGDAMAEMIPDLVALSQGSETASETLTRLYTNLQVANAYFGPLIDTLFQASLAGADLASTMIQAFGSLDAFSSSMSFFSQNFYTEAEQVAWASDRVSAAFKALGLAAPATADAFRSLVEGLMRDVTAGVAGAAATLAGVLATQQDALLVSSYNAQEATRIAQQQSSLEIRLLEAQGNSTEALRLRREAELATLDEVNRATLQQIFDAEDLSAAQKLAQAAAQAAQEAAQRAAQAAADAAADAAREAQAIAEEAAQKAERIAQERYDLETQLLELQGNTIELRSRELAILDPTNRALQEMVWKLSDAKDALTEINEIDFATKVDYLRAVGVARGGIAGFAAGGMHSGGARIVGENGPELEVTGPSRIYNKQDTSNMFRDPDLASAVQGLRNEVSGMRSEQLQLQVEISKNTKRVYDVERKWDIDGLPPVRV